MQHCDEYVNTVYYKQTSLEAQRETAIDFDKDTVLVQYCEQGSLAKNVSTIYFCHSTVHNYQ